MTIRSSQTAGGRRRAWRGVVAVLAIACGAPSSPGPAGTALAPGVELVSRSYEATDWIIANPERGLVQFVQLEDPGDVAFVAGLGVSLANARIRLDDYRDRPIDHAFLARLEAGFERIRAAGMKLVLRFQYNIGSGKDPSIGRVLEHLAQLAPLLRRNADVIAVLQAGFIGAWGEWHTSVSGLTEREHREALLTRLLEIMPDDRSIQVRSPVFKQAFAGGPASAVTAHGATAVARIGHHNDCFLSSDTDHGTFPDDRAREYLRADSRYVPVGGETCALSPPRTDCTNAMAELRQYHYSYLNRAYHPDVIELWRAQGCLHAITRDLGYRLVLRRAEWPARVTASGALPIALWIENLGYAAPFNQRPAFLVIGEGRQRHTIPLPELDVRKLQPGPLHLVQATVDVPRSVAGGEQPLSLWLPDAAPPLWDRPAYSVRLSNTGMWSETDGVNALGRLVVER